MDHSFSDEEKRFVLAEMLKVSRIEITAIVDLIKNRHIHPNYMEMELPRGRNMKQCLQALISMGIETPPTALSQHHSQFRQYGSQPPTQQLPQQPPQQQVQHPQQLQQHHRQQHMPQHRPHQQLQQHPEESLLPLSRPPQLSAKRRPSADSGEHLSKRAAIASTDALHPVSQPRTIQPRPADVPLSNSPPYAPPVARSLPKKRGRPSRADKVAQARAAGSYQPPLIAPASSIMSQNEGTRSVYHPASSRATPEGPIYNADHWEYQGMRRSADRSPQPGREPNSAPVETPADLAMPEPLPKVHVSSQDSPDETAKSTKASPHIAANPQPSSRLAVADLLKSTASTITTGV